MEWSCCASNCNFDKLFKVSVILQKSLYHFNCIVLKKLLSTNFVVFGYSVFGLHERCYI